MTVPNYQTNMYPLLELTIDKTICCEKLVIILPIILISQRKNNWNHRLHETIEFLGSSEFFEFTQLTQLTQEV